MSSGLLPIAGGAYTEYTRKAHSQDPGVAIRLHPAKTRESDKHKEEIMYNI